MFLLGICFFFKSETFHGGIIIILLRTCRQFSCYLNIHSSEKYATHLVNHTTKEHVYNFPSSKTFKRTAFLGHERASALLVASNDGVCCCVVLLSCLVKHFHF